MGRLGFHCRDAQNCSGTHVSVGNNYLQVTMFIIPRNPALRCRAIWPTEVKKLHESDDIGMIPWETNLAPNKNEIMRMSEKRVLWIVNNHLQKISKSMWSIQNRIFSIWVNSTFLQTWILDNQLAAFPVISQRKAENSSQSAAKKGIGNISHWRRNTGWM